MINFLIWIILGGILGWIASMIMRTDASQGTFLNIIVGIVGAFVAGLVLTPLLASQQSTKTPLAVPRLWFHCLAL
jgi:uncharacterized membrane protein YeaQ/YmgE (transglycosylase-associated protein family)